MTKHEEAIEAMARAIADSDHEGSDFGVTAADAMDCERGREYYLKRGRSALSALITLYPGIKGMIEGTHTAVPLVPDDSMLEAGMLEAGNEVIYDGRKWGKQPSAWSIYEAMIEAAAEGK